MPYGRRARYYHERQRHPSDFVESTFRTVPLSHTGYRGRKFAKWKRKGSGAKAIVGKLRKSGKWGVQSILIPKRRSRR